jgi:hypothetical protein
VWVFGLVPRERPYYVMADVLATPEDAREWLDPHSERVWEETDARAAGGVAFVSRQFKDGAVPTRV